MTLSRAGSRSQSEPSTQSLAEALTALCAEVGIPFEEMLHTVESALAAAYVRAFNPAGEVTVKLDTKTGALDVPAASSSDDGTVDIAEMLPSEDFKRMAAQTAKHAVLRPHPRPRAGQGPERRRRTPGRARERRGGSHRDPGTVYVDLGRAEGVMPARGADPGRAAASGPALLVVIMDAEQNRSRRRFASRAGPAPSCTA